MDAAPRRAAASCDVDAALTPALEELARLEVELAVSRDVQQKEVLRARLFDASAALAAVYKDSVALVRGPASRARTLLSECKVTLPHLAGTLTCRAYEYLQPVMNILRRRRATGTLLPGACRPYEVAYGRAIVRLHSKATGVALPADTLQVAGLLIGKSNFEDVAFPATLLASMVAHRLYALQTWAEFPDAFFHDLGLADASAARPGLTRDALADCISFACDALDMLAEGCITPSEANYDDEEFLGTVHELIRSAALQSVSAADAPLWQPLRDAWARVRRSAEAQRASGGGFTRTEQLTASILKTAEARAPARRSLRACANCGVRELAAAQFKRCAGCGSVVYCTNDCQTVAWPAHKATCKVLRRAASAAAASSAPP